ncbi:hypothetical protein AALO_G00145610 [Alosa alosa]|uniref:Uncharacterized protein n=3 Tax=Alosa alosa TaxID=278164 RepID=A0AAV6GQW6_9TELE|nr:hypothetical protein AALO_G00145610 [Alosa alosa]
MLQHYKDCSAAGPAPPQHPSNQSNFQVPQNLSHFVAGGDRKNGPAAAPGPGASVHGSAGAAGGFLGLQKTPQHVSSFPASSLLSAAAKAQMASQKSQTLGGAVGGGVASCAASCAGPEKDPQQSKGTVSSPSAGSTSVPCAPLLPSAVPEEMNSLVPLTEQDKSNGQNPPLLPPLLPPGMMGDLTALGNISGLHSLLGAGPLLLPQVPGPALGVPLPQGQGALNPLACLINSLQLNMGPTLTVDKQLGLAEATNAPQEEDIPVSQLAQEPVPNPGHVQSAQPPQRESAAAGALFDPYGSFMDTIYTSFLQVSGKDPDALGGGGGGSGGASSSSSSSSNPLSFPAPDLPALLAQPSAPPSLSPRRACSVHNSDLSRLGMEAAQSPARGTPKLSEDASSTPPPSKPGGGSEGHDDQAPPQTLPLPPAFLEEAKTDGSSSLCVYSNGLAAGTGLQEEREEGDGGRTQPQGYLSPRANAEPTQDSAVSNEADSGKESATRTGGRRGRKRKQVLERVAEGPGGLDSIIEEPQVTIALPKPARSTRGKRRRVVR